jgi:hypothetical protein
MTEVTATEIYTLYDGSKVCRMSAKGLVDISVWKGNRIIDETHASRIKLSIDGDIRKLDHLYRIVICPEKDATSVVKPIPYLIDGQHRHAVLQDHFKTHLCEDDFSVLVIVKNVSSEAEIIEYFNTINAVKPLKWKSDPHLIVNQYIAALEAEFNVRKGKPLIRPGRTHRPYLSVDELRVHLTRIAEGTGLSTDRGIVTAFVRHVRAWNDEEVRVIRSMAAVGASENPLKVKCAEHDFLLGFDTKHFKWIHMCINKIHAST